MDQRLERYEARTTGPLLVLALVFIAIYAAPIVEPGLPAALRRALSVASGVIWLVFAVDLALRVGLAERRLRYLASHPIDVLSVVLPALRPLRVLLVFTAGHALISRGGRLSILRTTQAIVVAAVLLVIIGALAILDAERGAQEANIVDLPDALWWAATTVTTVGYGDRFPVTETGRLVAVALMVVGISLVGTITATVAAWFVAQTSAADAEADADLEARLTRLEAQVAEIHSAVVADRNP